jgi:hypothetical protein
MHTQRERWRRVVAKYRRQCIALSLAKLPSMLVYRIANSQYELEELEERREEWKNFQESPV